MDGKPVDNAIFQQASRWAEEAYPLPKDSPLAVAVKTAIMGVVIAALFEVLDEWLARSIAEIVTIILCACVAFLDCRQKWTLHSRALRDAIERLETE